MKGHLVRAIVACRAKTAARFDDPNLVSHAGLVPAMRLAENIGLEELAAEHVSVNAPVGANPGVKIGSLAAGMVAGVDDIDGMGLLRHGAVPAVFTDSPFQLVQAESQHRGHGRGHITRHLPPTLALGNPLAQRIPRHSFTATSSGRLRTPRI
jgi:hypothetical protein